MWLYKKRQLEDEEDHEEETLHTKNSSILENEEKNCDMLFRNTEPYSDDFIIKNIVYKIVNSVEIEHQTSLKNVYYIDNFLSSNNVTYSSQTSTNYANNENKKRKHSNEDVEYLSTIGERESKKKVLDPIKEHFSWCPWLKENYSEDGSNLNSCLEKSSKIGALQKSICQINYEIIRRLLLERDYSKENTPKEETPSKITSSNKNSLTILEQVRSAQSILINCTSQFSLK